MRMRQGKPRKLVGQLAWCTQWWIIDPLSKKVGGKEQHPGLPPDTCLYTPTHLHLFPKWKFCWWIYSLKWLFHCSTVAWSSCCSRNLVRFQVVPFPPSLRYVSVCCPVWSWIHGNLSAISSKYWGYMHEPLCPAPTFLQEQDQVSAILPLAEVFLFFDKTSALWVYSLSSYFSLIRGFPSHMS